jgi:hypothetical protein
LKWDKNKGTKGYLRLIIDDAGVIGVLRCDIWHWFVWVPSDGGLYVGLDKGGSQCTGGYVRSSDGGLDGGGSRCASG